MRVGAVQTLLEFPLLPALLHVCGMDVTCPFLSCLGNRELRDSISSFASSCQLAYYREQRSSRSALRKLGKTSYKMNMGSLCRSLHFMLDHSPRY